MSAAHDFRIIGESESSDETIIRCTKCGKEIRYPGGPCDDATKLRWERRVLVPVLRSPCVQPGFVRNDGAEWIGFGWMLPVEVER